MKRFRRLILLGKLLIAFGEYGIPKAIRSDNASVFKTPLFRATLKLLQVQQQFTALHCPWQNGRIERFWRTRKETLGTNPVRFREKLRVIEEQMRFASVEAMQSVLSEFKDFYNHSRPHMALRGQTPAMVWNAQVLKRREKVQEKKRQVARSSPSGLRMQRSDSIAAPTTLLLIALSAGCMLARGFFCFKKVFMPQYSTCTFTLCARRHNE